MKIVKPSFEILAYPQNLEKMIERIARVCYKSEDKITHDSHHRVVDTLRQRQHGAMLEHGGTISVLFTCDRGVSHEMVRHRMASFAQESTRYCNYSKGQFGGEITVVEPPFWAEDTVAYRVWKDACLTAEAAYFNLLDLGAKPQETRSVLPNSLKTEIVVSANPREWLHIFKLRCAPEAHPQMVELMKPLKAQFALMWPTVFGD